MGLDQYAFATPKESISGDTDFAVPESAKRIAYWRKHPNLQGWMERLYRAKGGKDKEFNCAPVRVTLEDLAALEQAVMEERLPETSGFFFGSSQPEDMDLDLKFIMDARLAITAGNAVFYTSWW